MKCEDVIYILKDIEKEIKISREAGIEKINEYKQKIKEKNRWK